MSELAPQLLPFQLSEWLGQGRKWPENAPIELQSAFKAAVDIPDRYRRLIPDPDMPIAQLIGSTLPVVSTVQSALTRDDFFSRDDATPIPLVIVQEDVPPSALLLELRSMLKQKWLDGHCSLNGLGCRSRLPFWIVSFWLQMHDAIGGRKGWIKAQRWYRSNVDRLTAPVDFSHVKPAIELLFSVLGWNSRLNQSTNFTSTGLIPLFSDRMISGGLVDTVMVMFNSWAHDDPVTQTVKFETFDFQYPFLRDDLDWSIFDSDDPLQLTYLHSVRDSVQAGLYNTLICPLHVGNANHFAAAKLDLQSYVLAYRDSLSLKMEPRDFKGFDRFVGKIQAGASLSSKVEVLPHAIQDDGFSCAVVTCNTCERAVWPATRPWRSGAKGFARVEYALLLATHNDSTLNLVDIGLPETLIKDRHSYAKTPSSSRSSSVLRSPVPFITQRPQASDSVECDDRSSDELGLNASVPIAEEPMPVHTQQQLAPQTGLLSYFAVISRDEAERQRLATREQRLEEDADRMRIMQQREALKKIAKAEKIKFQNRERQRNKRQRERAQKDASTRLTVNDVLLPSRQEDPSNAKTAELSRPRRLFKEDAAKNRDVRGRKREHEATDAKLNNWVNPLLWQQIVNAGHQAGPQLSPTEIVKILKARNPQNFSKLTPQVLGRYIERPLDSAPRWKESVLARVERGTKPGGHSTRNGVLNQYPDIVEAVVRQLTLLRQAGIPVHVRIARGIMLAHIEHGAPELLHAIASDGSRFRCTDSYVRKFLYQHLRWVPCKPTKASQSTPSNAEEQIWHLFLRLALLLRDAGIRHAELVANFDQTQVVVADNGSHTFEVEGSKQVAVTSKEEKRAWTAVVGVTAAGNVLPTQIVMKGGSGRSLPSPNSPGYAESKELGLLFGLNAKNYWSNIPLLEEYFEKIITPHFSMQKQRLGYPEDQECVVLLDCWSVHRSEEFQNLVRRRWPWLRLRYIPGGCTGLAQPCDVGIQRPYKLSIKRSQLDDIINETLAHLESNGDPTKLKLDSRIGTLRDRSVTWFIKAWKEINQVGLVKKSFEHCIVRGGFNLSFESLTSSAALKVLRELPRTDPALWAKISYESASVSDDAEAVADTALAEDQDPFLDDADDDSDETALEPNVLMAQILSEPVSADCLPGAADTLELEEVQIPDPEEFGRGKRRKTANKKYQGFEHH